MNCIKIAIHRIKVTALDVFPINSAPYRVGPETSAFEMAEIEKMLHMNDIEHAQSEWASVIVFVLKRDGLSRFCINYRKLNSVEV